MATVWIPLSEEYSQGGKFNVVPVDLGRIAALAMDHSDENKHRNYIYLVDEGRQVTELGVKDKYGAVSKLMDWASSENRFERVTGLNERGHPARRHSNYSYVDFDHVGLIELTENLERQFYWRIYVGGRRASDGKHAVGAFHDPGRRNEVKEMIESSWEALELHTA